MGIKEWFLKPFKDLEDQNASVQVIPEEPELEVPISQDVLYHPETQPTIFRPDTFDTYIGQERAKSILKAYIKGVKENNALFPHILIHGKAGTGKTTLAKIVAHEVDVSLVEVITSSIKHFWKLKMMINQNEGNFLFLDEIHALERDMAEQFYTIMEDFTYNGDPVSHFTIVGATTEIGEILKTRKPFYDRFKIIIELEDYSTEDLTRIIEQYQEKIFPDKDIAENVFEEISINCRTIPRMAIRLLEATVFVGDVIQVLRHFGILYKGYNINDLKALKYIEYNKKGVGLQSIASFLGTSKENYLYQTEPYLLQNQMILRTPRGRKISEKGSELIKILEQVEI